MTVNSTEAEKSVPSNEAVILTFVFSATARVVTLPFASTVATSVFSDVQVHVPGAPAGVMWPTNSTIAPPITSVCSGASMETPLATGALLTI